MHIDRFSQWAIESLNILNILVLHRFPIDIVVGTNPSFPAMVEYLSKKAHRIVFMSFKGGAENKLGSAELMELKWDFKRGDPFDKVLKTFLWIVLVPWIVTGTVKKQDIDLIYCDDSIPLYPFVVKKLVGGRAKVIMRLGDLQSGYLFADQGFLKDMLFNFFHSLEVFMWKTMDGIICLSYPFKKFLEQKKVPSEKIFVVKESIDVDFFHKKNSDIRRRYNVPEDKVLIMFHGAIEKCKGIEVLIEAAEKLFMRNDRIYFMIVGDGSSLKQIKRSVEKRCLKDRFIFTGWIPFEQMPDYVNAADMGIALRSVNMANHFVVTTALLQYWACQKPLLVPSLEAIKEVVVDGENAVVFEVGNSIDLMEKIEHMLEIEDKWPSIGKAGRKVAERLFEKEKIGSEIANVITDLALS